ncbi:ABC transporter ATP-binding protein [Metabacillus halosaccharovorans]|uniref:ABC transporter ATP-binding protein n=1 Tax=Metabacillus halosaccharovorans TaxID=930124 RepID=A0ABT3DHS7_9BACI|nr:ABC transporter ATP-binding protein [Metabacillus halosaccharovorans]MCM3441633.1 ABC transporter ATP-binding protein [Metabacillus halosaccharovorans]MCV9886441.1 ABC transporter ATP-binding protein [Metabacillus halosaccharovorans]
MANKILQFNNISFHYEKDALQKPILKNLNLELYEGEFISFLGPSGSGKSTLFKLITGLEQPSEGEIFLRNQLVINRLGQVGYMPQQDLLLPWRTIVENAALPLEIKGLKKREAYKKVILLLDEFGLKGVENHFPSDLSGGMRQRVSFLRTILSGSNILLLDEPFSALDAITKLSLQEWLLAQWQKRNETILFITHDVNEALFLSDRIFVFSESPTTKLKEIKIPLLRPRNIKDLNHPEILQLKDELLDELRTRQKL